MAFKEKFIPDDQIFADSNEELEMKTKVMKLRESQVAYQNELRKQIEEKKLREREEKERLKKEELRIENEISHLDKIESPNKNKKLLMKEKKRIIPKHPQIQKQPSVHYNPEPNLIKHLPSLTGEYEDYKRSYLNKKDPSEKTLIEQDRINDYMSKLAKQLSESKK